MMAFTDKTITPDELRHWSLNLVTNYHSDRMDEPYDGAGYCTCWLCQEIAPRFSAGADTLESVIAERDALRKLVEDLKLGAECYLTAVADLQAGYTPDTHPDWNAVQYLAGEAHAAILRANDVLGVDAGGDESYR